VPALPEVPTLAEAALRGFNSISWIGLLAPAGTPKDIVDQFQALIDADRKRYAQAIKDKKISVE
jgi:tripartite-type tricarboxylate transporter receptor subunit TctC